MSVKNDAALNIEKYLKFIGAEKYSQKKNGRLSLEMLEELTTKHTLAVPYQSYDLFRTQNPPSLSAKCLEEKIVEGKRGGMCYESSELLCHALLHFGFEVKRVPVYVLTYMPYDENSVSTHNILICSLEGKLYLIDIGFGYNSLRRPVEFSFQNTEERTLLSNEKYQLVCAQDYYQLNIWMKDAWTPFYLFKRPFEFMGADGTMKYYRKLLTATGEAPIRDSVLKFGRMLENGRLGIMCTFDKDKAEVVCKLLEIYEHCPPKTTEISYEEVQKIIKPFINIDISENKFLTRSPVRVNGNNNV